MTNGITAEQAIESLGADAWQGFSPQQRARILSFGLPASIEDILEGFQEGTLKLSSQMAGRLKSLDSMPRES